MRKLLVKLVIALIASLRYNQERPAKPCVVAIWHEDIFPACKFFSYNSTVSLNSPSRDVDDYIMPTLKHFAITSVRATSSKPQTVLRGLFQLMKYTKQHCIVITADGPRGPRYKSKAGVLIIAQRQQIPLYACRFSYKHFRAKRTWDKLKVPPPFAKITAHFSSPIFIAKDANLTKETAKLNKRMMALLQTEAPTEGS